MTVYAGRYEIGALLGEGAHGRVHDAFDLVRSERVALKLLAAPHDETRARWTMELDHRGLVRVFDVGPSHVAMERVDGVDLVTHVRGPARANDPSKLRPTLHLAFGTRVQEGNVSAFSPCDASALARARSAFSQLARAIRALHARGKVHGDLKPSNVVVEASGRVVVLDYGLAVDEGARRDDVVGTASYMAPEQSGAPATLASDAYAVGVMLFEALTGAPPFEGSAQEVMLRKQTLSAPRPSLLVDVDDDALDDACVRLLRRSVGERAGLEILESEGTG
jgi:serine/threonine protein kinase